MNASHAGKVSQRKRCSSTAGAEAIENAVKIARAYTKRPGIIAFEDAFHGRTMMAMAMTSKTHPYKAGFEPFPGEVYRIPYAYCYRCSYSKTYPSCELYCARHLEDTFKRVVAAEDVAAVIVEPILGEGGFVAPPPGLLRGPDRVLPQARHSCHRRRSANRFRPHRALSLPASVYGIEPDLITMREVSRRRSADGSRHRPRRNYGCTRRRAAWAAPSLVIRCRARRRSPYSTLSREKISMRARR